MWRCFECGMKFNEPAHDYFSACANGEALDAVCPFCESEEIEEVTRVPLPE
jgi:hypothetical protein